MVLVGFLIEVDEEYIPFGEFKCNQYHYGSCVSSIYELLGATESRIIVSEELIGEFCFYYMYIY